MEDDCRVGTGLALYVGSGGKVSRPEPPLVAEQIGMAGSIGIRGFHLFSHERMSEAILKALRRGPCSEPALPTSRVGPERGEATLGIGPVRAKMEEGK